LKDQQEPTVIAEAPPLVWPSWLVHIEGTQLKIQQGAEGKLPALQSSFYTNVPMTKVRAFYEDLFKTNNYQIVTGGLETGHTMSGVQQNAFGQVAADYYPDGQPGPWIDIRVSFSRQVLNGPIRVYMKMTSHPYARYGPELTHKHKLPPLPSGTPRGANESQEAADERARAGAESMKKYDQPIRPRPGPPIPGLTWPAWLVHIEGQPLKIQKSVNGSSMTAFTSSYTTAMDIESIRSFYADQLSYNGYSVAPIYLPRTQSAHIPASHGGSVKGVSYPNGSPGPRFEILVQFRPADFKVPEGPNRVDLRVSAFSEEQP
jgi:hypothetical protein